MEKVLVTGPTGFIGSHLTETLLNKGYHVKCLVRKTSNLKWLKDLNVELVYSDLFDKKILSEAISDISYLYHVAGVTFAKRKEEFYLGNRDATKSLIDICYKANPSIKRFIHVSTQAVVGPSLSKDHPVDETAGYNPLTTYGLSKMEAEKIVREYFGKMNCTIVRPPAVYGPRDVAIFEFFKAMSRGLQPMIGFGDKLVSLIHVYDLVNGFVMSGESPKAINNIFFISSEKYYSWREVGDITCKIMNKNALRIKVPHFTVYTLGFLSQVFAMFSSKPAILNLEKSREITQAYWTCSVEKAKKDFGFKEELSLEQGIENTVKWYKEQKWIK